jgi:hypothetical protein
MTPEQRQRLRQLCRLIEEERDNSTLLALLEALNDLLDENEQQLAKDQLTQALI